MPMTLRGTHLGNFTWAQLVAAYPNGASNAPLGAMATVTDYPPNSSSLWVRVTESGGPWWAPMNAITWPIAPAYSTTGDTSEHDAYTFTLKAGMLRLYGGLEFARAQFYGTDNGNSKTLRLRIGGTSIDSNGVTSGALASSFGIQNQGSQSAQTYWYHQTSSYRATFTLNTAADLTVALQLTNSDAADTAYLTGGLITHF